MRNIFESRIKEWLRPFGEECMKNITGRSYSFTLTDDCVQSVEEDLFFELYKILQPVLREEVDHIALKDNPFWGIDTKKIPAEVRRAAAEKLLTGMEEEGPGCFQDRFPLLYDLFSRKTLSFENGMTTMLDLISQNAESLSEGLFEGRRLTRIQNIKRWNESVRKGGNTTAIIETNAGKMVFKPRDCRIDQWFRNFSDEFFSESIKVPDVVCIGDQYGFFEFVVNRPASDEKEACDFYYNLGVLFTAILITGGTDFHKYNFLASGSKVVPVDLETIMRPYDELRVYPGKKFVDNSLLYSLAFPKISDRYEDCGDSSLFTADSDANASVPVISGVRQMFHQYKEYFYRGFTETYRKCMEKREIMKEWIRRAVGLRIRTIMISRKAYLQYLTMITRPENLKDEETRSRLKNHLYSVFRKGKKRNGEKISEREAEDIIYGDEPYFYTDTDCGNVYSEGDLLTTDYFDATPIQRSLEYLSIMSEEELAFEKRYIDVAVRMAKIDLPEDPSRLSEPELNAVMRDIEENAVTTPDNYRFWPCRTDDRIRYSQIQTLIDSTEKINSFLADVHIPGKAFL